MLLLTCFLNTNYETCLMQLLKNLCIPCFDSHAGREPHHVDAYNTHVKCSTHGNIWTVDKNECSLGFESELG